jgi:bacteriocin-like protein
MAVADLKETTMSKNKDTEKTRELTEDELNHVSGGYIDDALGTGVRSGIIKDFSFGGYKCGAAEAYGN